MSASLRFTHDRQEGGEYMKTRRRKPSIFLAGVSFSASNEIRIMAKMGNMLRNGFAWVCILISASVVAEPATTQSSGSETDALSYVIQLTSGFDRAGEAYF